MLLTEDDIRKAIYQCVRLIMEAHGAIDDKLLGLAQLIINRIKSGETSFTIDHDELAEYYPYKNVPDSLNVAVADLYSYYTGIKAKYGIETNTIKIDSTLVSFLKDGRYKEETESKIIEILMHEITHFVNHFESGEDVATMPRPCKMERTEPSKYAKRILYLFDPGEIQARISEFKWALRNGWENRKTGKPKRFSDYDRVTHLNSMKNMIDAVRNDVQPGDDEDLSIVELLLLSRGNKKMQIDGRERMLNPSPQDFEKAKASIVKKLTRAYNDYFQKLSKIYYDEINGAS